MPTRIGQRLSAVRQDSRVTRAEAERIVKAAQAEPKWTTALHAELSTFVERHGAALDPQAREVLEAFVASASPRADLKDPLVLKGDRTSVSWTPVAPDASLYVDGLTAEDVVQGYIDNCYLAAGVASLAAADPSLLRDAIKVNGDGTYTVRFFEGVGEGGRPKPVYVTVDDDVARKPRGAAVYLTSSDDGELWPGVVEKAYAKWKGGYQRIGNGGNASDLFEALSGRVALSRLVTDFTPTALWKKLETAAAKGRPAAAGTFGAKDPRARYRGTGLHPDHFYSVLDARVEKGVKVVVLRNPWGTSEPRGNGRDDGVFTLPYSDFLAKYHTVELGG